MNYEVLIPELQTDPLGRAYSALSDAQTVESLHAKNRTRIVSRFGSFRTLAALLTAEEYATVRAALDAAAASSTMLADMLVMLKLPGDAAGNNGGIDLGNATVRAMLDAMCTTEVATKIKAYAEDTISRAEELGIPDVGVGHINSARGGE